MKYLSYPLAGHGYINRFVAGELSAKVEQFDKVTLKGEVNEWLKYGFAIHENPCRGQFVAARNEQLPPYVDFTQLAPTDYQVYFPFGNLRVENSAFYYRPTSLRTY